MLYKHRQAASENGYHFRYPMPFGHRQNYSMSLLKDYRLERGISQRELADELKEIFPAITAPLISLMENDKLATPPDVIEYLQKAFINAKTGVESEKSINYPFSIKTMLNRPFYRAIYDELMKHDSVRPASRGDLILATGCTDRDVRKGISELRNAGLRIASSSGKYGYWLCNSDADYAAMRNELRGKAFSLLAMVKAMDECDINQVELWEDTQE